MADFLSRRWRRQPQGPVGVDWNNPLAEGLTFAPRLALDAVDLVTGKAPAGAVPVEPRSIGLCRSYTETAEHTWSGIGGFRLSTTGEFSFVVQMMLGISAGTWPWIITGKDGAGDYLWHIEQDGTKIYSGVRKSTGSKEWVGLSPAFDPGLRVPFVYGLSWDGSRMRSYANGRLYATSAVIAPYVDSGSGGSLIVGNLAGVSLDFAASFICTHGRVLSNDEHQGLSENLWQLFKPRREILYSFPSGASKTIAGSAVSAALGTFAPSATSALTGSAASASAGTIAPDRTVALSGAQATVSAGTVSAGSDTTAALTGAAVSADAGSVATAHANALAGSAAVASTGTLVAGRAKAVAGAEASATTGALTPERAVALTGAESGAVAGTLSVVAGNNVTVALTGAQAAAAAGSVASTRTVALTGSYVSAIAGNVVVLGGRGQEAAGRPKHRRVILGDRLYRVLERDIPALLEAELLDRAPPVTAEVIEGPKPPRKRGKKAVRSAYARTGGRAAPQPVKTVEQVREAVQQIKARIEPDNAWLAQALETVAFRVLERLQDEEDSLMLLLAA